MSRNLAVPMLAKISSNEVSPIVLADLALVSGVERIWSGVGSLIWNGNTYAGVGSLGALGDVKEGLEVKAEGTSIMLSGIDSGLLNDTLNDIQIGAAVAIWIGAFDAGAVVSSPYPAFRGTVDRPMISIGGDQFSISLALETKMSNLQRATNRRYTASDQRYYYGDDTGFYFVEVMNDLALRWG